MHMTICAGESQQQSALALPNSPARLQHQMASGPSDQVIDLTDSSDVQAPAAEPLKDQVTAAASLSDPMCFTHRWPLRVRCLAYQQDVDHGLPVLLTSSHKLSRRQHMPSKQHILLGSKFVWYRCSENSSHSKVLATRTASLLKHHDACCAYCLP